MTLAMLDDAHRACIERGEQPPAPVNGFAIIDTGANATCFDADAAQRAGLLVVGATHMTSASHASHRVLTFAGKIVCPDLTIDLEAGMGANLSAVDDKLVALLGRDTLKSAILIYNGPDGHFSLAT